MLKPSGRRVADAGAVSTLLFPKVVRTSFCTRKVSSSVQREEVMPPIQPRPYVAWIRLNSEATRPIASCHETSRHGSVIVSRIIGLRMRSR